MRRTPFLLSWTRASLFAPLMLCAWSVIAHAQAEQATPPSRSEAPSAPEAGASESSTEEEGAHAAATPKSGDAELDDERARTHFAAGDAYFGAERYSDAAREFALAYELSRRPEMLVNLSRAHERGGELRAAVADLELLLELYPATSYRGEALERIARMRAQLVAPPRAIAASEVTADERPAPAVESAQRAGSSWPSWTTLSLAAGAGVSTAILLGTGIRAHHIYNQLEARCPGDACTPPFEGERTHGRRLARTSTGFTVAAVALAGAAAMLWIYEARAKRRSLALGAALEGVGAEARLRAQF